MNRCGLCQVEAWNGLSHGPSSLSPMRRRAQPAQSVKARSAFKYPHLVAAVIHAPAPPHTAPSLSAFCCSKPRTELAAPASSPQVRGDSPTPSWVPRRAVLSLHVSDRNAGARVCGDGQARRRRGRAAPAHGGRQYRGGGVLRVHRQVYVAPPLVSSLPLLVRSRARFATLPTCSMFRSPTRAAGLAVFRLALWFWLRAFPSELRCYGATLMRYIV
jgi:hypothetical protein